MSGDQTDDNGADPNAWATLPRPVIENDGADKRSVILRVSGQADTASLIADIVETGSMVVSEGGGVIVIEGIPEQIEHLRRHKWIIAIEEPKQFQMRPPKF